MHSPSCANTYHDVTTFEVDKILTEHDFSLKQKILKLTLKDCLFKNYHFLVEVTLKVK